MCMCGIDQLRMKQGGQRSGKKHRASKIIGDHEMNISLSSTERCLERNSLGLLGKKNSQHEYLMTQIRYQDHRSTLKKLRLTF